MLNAEFAAPVLRDALASVILAASTDEERPSMNSVNFDVGPLGTRLTATDGHWLAEHTIEAVSVEESGHVAVPSERIKKLLAMLADETGSVHLVADQALVRFDCQKLGRLDSTPIDNFPPSEQVWPKGDGQRMSRIGMNPKLLAKVGKAFRCKDGHGIAFVFFGENHPILINSEALPDMRALLMPMKQLSLDLEGPETNGAKNGKAHAAPETIEHRGQTLHHKRAGKPPPPKMPKPKTKRPRS